MKYTPNYNFKKPEPTDTVNIEDFNTSFDLVDEKLGNLDQTFEQLIINAGKENAEIVAAHVAADGSVYDKIGDRFNNNESQLAEIALNIKSFGAIGNGAHDDTAAIQSAINYAYTNNIGKVFIPSGTYLVTQKIDIDFPVEICGVGRQSKILLGGNIPCTAAPGTAEYIIDGSFGSVFYIHRNSNKPSSIFTSQLENVNIHDLYFCGSLRSYTANCITMYGVDHCRFYNLDIAEFKGSALVISAARECFYDNINIRLCGQKCDDAEDVKRFGHPSIDLKLSPFYTYEDATNLNTFCNIQNMMSYFVALRLDSTYHNQFVNCNFHQLHPEVGYIGTVIEDYPSRNGKHCDWNVIQLIRDYNSLIDTFFIDRFVNCIFLFAGEYSAIAYVENKQAHFVGCTLGWHWNDDGHTVLSYYAIEAKNNAKVKISADTDVVGNSWIILKDDSSTFLQGADTTDLERVPIKSYIHTSNTEIYISTIDVATNTFTSNSHGLSNGDLLFPVMTNGISNCFLQDKYPGGITSKGYPGYYVVNVTTNTFQLSLTSGGAAIDITENANLDLSKWHFEKTTGTFKVTISNLPSLQKCKIIIKGRTVRNNYSPAAYPFNIPESNIWYKDSTGTPLAPSTSVCGDIMIYDEIIIDTTQYATVIHNGFSIASNTALANKYTLNDTKLVTLNYRNISFTSLIVDCSLANGSTIEVYKA